MKSHMQCKDIPTIPVLEFIRDHNGRASMLYNAKEDDVWKSMPRETPEVLIKAKMRMLLNHGLVNGCGCGNACYGQYTLTEKGMSKLL